MPATSELWFETTASIPVVSPVLIALAHMKALTAVSGKQLSFPLGSETCPGTHGEAWLHRSLGFTEAAFPLLFR